MAASQGLPRVTLGMMDENEPLKRRYMNCGFVNTGYRKYPKAPFTVGYMEWSGGKSTALNRRRTHLLAL